MAETSSPSTSPAADASSPQHHQTLPALPPLTTTTTTMTTTTPAPPRRSNLPRPMSHASKNRLSQYSAASVPSRSRPQSHTFPMSPSSLLAHTLVRDFAYPASHPMHHGPPPEPSGPPSGLTTPASEHRRLSDPPTSWEQRMPWDSWKGDTLDGGTDVPPIHCGDGPPYSEDEDLQSPVVATRHRKHKSTSGALAAGKARSGREPNMMSSSNFDNERGYFVGRSGDGSERYYVNQEGEANGPGGEFVTYPPDHARHSRAYHYAQQPQQVGENEACGSDDCSSSSSPGYHDADQSRYSRDYQFTITSPDEEFHGKAVALFDFERENENELPLVEGQIIWVSYRHGQGWLVAEDPKTQESGLVPEAYVRLLRDIEGGMNSLTGQVVDGPASPNEAGTPTQAEHGGQDAHHHQHTSSNTTNGYHQPVVSTFSTSSKDLNPYPTEQLGIQAGQTPPQVVHYHGQRGGSQANTPTVSQHKDSGLRRGSQDSGNKGDADAAPTQHNSTSWKAAGTAREGDEATDGDR